MPTGADTSIRRHIDAKSQNADRKGGDQTANIEKTTEAEPVFSSNPQTISLFPGELSGRPRDRSTGAPTDPDVQDSRIRLFESSSR